MSTQVGYCTTAQIQLAVNAKRLIAVTDDDRSNASDTGVLEQLARTASNLIAGLIFLRPEYADLDALDPMAYTTGDHPMVEDMAAQLGADLALHRSPKEGVGIVDADHWVLVLAGMIGRGEMNIPTV